MQIQRREDKLARWYFGGAAGCMAVCITHPLDTLKVNLQTQQKVEFGLVGVCKNVVREGGVRALYNGLSAAILRQATYTTTRFGIYEVVKTYKKGQLAFYEKIGLAGMAGFCGGFVGTPADLVNVRMQNDIKLPVEKRRMYKNAIDGMIRVYKEEGITRMWGGGLSASSRGFLMNIGQLGFYEQFKQLLLESGYFKDNLATHFTASTMAGSVAVLLTMPLDVTKTRLMNAPPGTYSGMMSCIADIAKNGPSGFFKGFLPAFIRLAPHTILTFVFLEQLRLNFGYFKPSVTPV